MQRTLKSKSLAEISYELSLFDSQCSGIFRCPTCLRDYDADSKEVTEEHIIPASNGGKHTTFLCRECNSGFGRKQTRWLSDWIELNEGNGLFPSDPKKQRVKWEAKGHSLNGTLRIAEDDAVEFIGDARRTNPGDLEYHMEAPKPDSAEITIDLPLFRNENALRVGFLTAAYGLWFKNLGYSFVLQSSMDVVRKQILHPDLDIMKWCYLVEAPAKSIESPEIGFMRFDETVFPVALIYDTLVILPASSATHPSATTGALISRKALDFSNELSPRCQHRCIGPTVVICGGQLVINPDLQSIAATPPQYLWVDRWH